MALENEQRKKSKSLSAPTDIIVILLLRLPVESLQRFKSIRKLWNSLISDPHFLYDKSFNVLDHDYPLKDRSKSVAIVGSFNGLLCIVIQNVNENLIAKRKRRNEKEIDSLFIWNPSTRRSSSRLPYYCDSEFLPSGYNDRYGFGYDESSDDYKVVKVYCHSFIGGFKFKVMIYSLKTGKWKHISDFTYGNPSVYTCTFANGAFHSFARLNKSFSPTRIISLDLEKETYGEVLQPVYHEVPTFFWKNHCVWFVIIMKFVRMYG